MISLCCPKPLGQGWQGEIVWLGILALSLFCRATLGKFLKLCASVSPLVDAISERTHFTGLERFIGATRAAVLSAGPGIASHPTPTHTLLLCSFFPLPPPSRVHRALWNEGFTTQW